VRWLAHCVLDLTRFPRLADLLNVKFTLIGRGSGRRGLEFSFSLITQGGARVAEDLQKRMWPLFRCLLF